MARHTPRHAPRHAARRPAWFSGTRRPGSGRPVLTAGVAAAMLSVGAVGATVTGGTASAEPLTFAVDGFTSATSTEEARAGREDAARVAADRAATNAQRAAAAAKAAEVEKARAAVLAKQRKAAAERAARAAERQRIVANAQEDPKAVARMLLPEFGFGQGQWSCLDQLWIGESDWRWDVENPSSGAYGIPQSLPGKKMATMGADWRTNPVTQIRWGLDYIKKSYGTPCNALDFWNGNSPHWY
jgi:murein DD-endopeptidase MepM/ murein hydrolase activator NlpD